MARRAQEAGLPPELPVMAGLVESGLFNNPGGDADSVGFFQMRVSIWDQGAYAGYQTDPEKQLQWFIDQALALREKRIEQGVADFGQDPGKWGEWIADVERPADLELRRRRRRRRPGGRGGRRRRRRRRRGGRGDLKNHRLPAASETCLHAREALAGD